MIKMNWNEFVQDILIPGVSILEKIVRPLLVYAFLLVGLRLAGRRELAQLNSFDFVVLLMLSNTVQNAIIGNDNSVTGGFIGAAVLLLVNGVLVRFLSQHPKWSRIFEGEAVYLIKGGWLDRKELERQSISQEELETLVRKQGLDNLAEVQDAVLETSGAITLKTQKPGDNMLLTQHEAHLKRIEAQLELLMNQQKQLLAHLQKTK